MVQHIFWNFVVGFKKQEQCIEYFVKHIFLLLTRVFFVFDFVVYIINYNYSYICILPIRGTSWLRYQMAYSFCASL